MGNMRKNKFGTLTINKDEVNRMTVQKYIGNYTKKGGIRDYMRQEIKRCNSKYIY